MLVFCHTVLSVSCSLLRKDRTLSFLVYDVFLCFCHFTIWCPGADELLDCNDSRSLPSSSHTVSN